MNTTMIICLYGTEQQVIAFASQMADLAVEEKRMKEIQEKINEILQLVKA